jgi:hypothetical protein
VSGSEEEVILCGWRVRRLLDVKHAGDVVNGSLCLCEDKSRRSNATFAKMVGNNAARELNHGGS